MGKPRESGTYRLVVVVEDPHIGYDFLRKERFFLGACLRVLRGPRLDAFKAFSQMVLQLIETAEGNVQQEVEEVKCFFKPR